jgi:hypothetical protein
MSLTIGATDHTAVIQDRSLKLTLNTLDVVLIDPASDPAMGDTIAWTGVPAWTGPVVSLSARTYRSDGSDHRFVSITGKNTTALADEGDCGFGLSDAPNGTTTFGYRDLVIESRQVNTTTEIRGSLICWHDGIVPGMEVAITSPADGLTAATYTVTITCPTCRRGLRSTTSTWGPGPTQRLRQGQTMAGR